MTGSAVRLRRPYKRAAPAGFGLERLATAFMNHPGLSSHHIRTARPKPDLKCLRRQPREGRVAAQCHRILEIPQNNCSGLPGGSRSVIERQARHSPHAAPPASKRSRGETGQWRPALWPPSRSDRHGAWRPPSRSFQRDSQTDTEARP